MVISVVEMEDPCGQVAPFNIKTKYLFSEKIKYKYVEREPVLKHSIKHVEMERLGRVILGVPVSHVNNINLHDIISYTSNYSPHSIISVQKN